MTVLRGGRADRIPFTLYGWITPDTPAAKTLHRRGLTPINSAPLVRVERKEVSFEHEEVVRDGKRLVLSRISTPVGSVDEVAGFEPGYGSRWILEHYVKSVEDFEVIRYLFDHSRAEPNRDSYPEADRRMGDDGIIIGGIGAIPVQQLLTDLMGTDMWCEAVMLHADEFQAVLDSMTRLHKREVEIAAESPAEVIWFPDNLTGLIMSPARFEMYCAPIYDYACSVLRQAGKLSFAHYDGANLPIKDQIAKTGFDIMEAFTPPPMGEMTVAEARAAWPDKVLSLNFPGNLFRESAEVIRRWTRTYIEEAGDPRGFVIGCTENFDACDFERAFNAIADAMADG